jgi:CubicO group peptidase (beta-lactamase class C family)
MSQRLPLALIAALVTVALMSPAARTQPGRLRTASASQAASQYAKILSSVYKADQPGAAALVAKGDEIVFLGAAGMADLELAVPLAPDMVFEIGSITKQFTAAAIMLLSEQGKLAVSDPMTKHLPSYPSYGQNITVEHLLTHTSGIVSYTGVPGYMASKVRNDVTVQQLIDVFKDLPVEFAPGERYAYNNSGYILLGAIVEAASGMRYEDFVRKRLFEPLGMKTAYYGCSTCIIPRRASGYDGGPNEFTNQRYLSFTQPYAAGSLMMTVSDLHRWSRALFGGKVVSEASLKRMTTPYVLKNGEPTGYGYGLSIASLRGRRAIRHGGGIFGFVTDALYLPDQDVFVAVFSNNAAGGINPGLPASKLAALAVGDPFPEFTEVAVPEDVLRRYVGVYEISKGVTRTVTLRDGALYTQRTGGALTRTTAASPTRFFYRTSLSYFDFVIEDGRVTAMVAYQDGGSQGERAVKVPDKR